MNIEYIKTQPQEVLSQSLSPDLWKKLSEPTHDFLNSTAKDSIENSTARNSTAKDHIFF